ncbi:MAG: inorganic diphosphatase [Ktedonobacterales bacterium]
MAETEQTGHPMSTQDEQQAQQSALRAAEQVAPDHERGWVEAVVEIPRGGRNKYEYDHERGIFRLDRVLYSSVHYPTDYGFIPDTLSGDGDPLDILIIVEEPTFPGCHLRARPIGTLTMIDEKGEDEKILAVPVDDPRFSDMRDLPDLHEHWPREIATFFRTYKELQGVQTDVREWSDVGEAWRIIAEARERYTQAEKNPHA